MALKVLFAPQFVDNLEIILAYYDKRNAKGIFVAILLMSFAPLLVGLKVAWYAHILGFLVGYGYGFLKKRYGIF